MSTNDRRGVALLIALVALLIIGALVSATLVRVQSDLRLAREGLARRRAEVAAERLVRVAMGTTSSAAVRAVPVGGRLAMSDFTDGVATTLTIVRVDSTLAWLAATAVAPAVRGSARALVGVSAIVAPAGAAPLQPLDGDAWTPVY